MLFALNVVAQVLLVVSSLLLVLSILLHKGQGGGMSDMFGGGLTSAMSSSGVGQRNLNIATVVTSLVWLFAIVLFSFTMDRPTVDDATNKPNTNLSTQLPNQPSSPIPTSTLTLPQSSGSAPAK